MKRILALLIVAGVAACAQPKKKSGSAAESAPVDRKSAGQFLLAARTAAQEADAAIRETESTLSENDLGESVAMRNGGRESGNERSATNPGSANNPDRPMSDNVTDGSSGTADSGKEGDGSGRERSANRSGGNRTGGERGDGGRNGGGGSNPGGDGVGLGDMMGGTTGGARESSSGAGPEAEVIEDENNGSTAAGRERGRAGTMEDGGRMDQGDGSDAANARRTRANNSRASGSGSNFDAENLEREINRAEREAIAAAETAGEGELKNREERGARTDRSDSSADGSRSRNESGRANGERSAEPDAGPGNTESARNSRTNSGRRTSVAGSTDPGVDVERTEREAGSKSEAEAVALRESEPGRRTHRRTIITDTEKNERTKTAEREDGANLRLNKEGTFTDTRGSAQGPETMAREESQKSGLIASDTYQVFVTVFGSSKDQAMRQGKIDARLKAYNLLLKEHRGGRRLSETGRRDLRQFINRNGQVTDVSRQSENSWNVTLQIKNPRLRSFLKKLR